MERKADNDPVVGWKRFEDESGPAPEQAASKRGLFRDRNGITVGGFLVYELVCWGAVLTAIIVAAA